VLVHFLVQYQVLFSMPPPFAGAITKALGLGHLQRAQYEQRDRERRMRLNNSPYGLMNANHPLNVARGKQEARSMFPHLKMLDSPS
jgi:hypothetical protein